MIQKESDLTPYLDALINNLFVPLKEVLPELRATAAKAFKALGARFQESLARMLIEKVRAVLEDEKTQAVERAGAAQAFTELLFLMDESKREQAIDTIFKLTRDPKPHIQESFLNVMVYVPIVFGEDFAKYVSASIETIIEAIGADKERTRNLAIKSLKTIIQNFLEKKGSLIVEPLVQGAFSSNISRRQSSLILLGDVIEVLQVNLPGLEVFERFPILFAILYIAKNDDNNDSRLVAYNIFKTFVPNVQRALKLIIRPFVFFFLDVLERGDEAANQLCANGINEFSSKYGDTFLYDIMEIIQKVVVEFPDKVSPFKFLNYVIQFFSSNCLTPARRGVFREFLNKHIGHPQKKVRELVHSSLKTIVNVTADWKPATVQVTEAANVLNSAAFDSPQAEYSFELLVELTTSNSEKLVDAIVKEVLKEEDLKEW